MRSKRDPEDKTENMQPERRDIGPSFYERAIRTTIARITQPTVSQHLKVLWENGFAQVRAEGTRRLYSVDTVPLQETDAWLDRFRHFWAPHLDALTTELARGKRERRLSAEHAVADGSDGPVGPRL